ncbi:Ig-like domain-containing protein [uncultured Methanobrevibacter sp.]|uniref:Ig-like domain-containing protein n=1 Tax=uncultured Methanobrevibacter sp. TaxID=253161 RepID=UPI0025F3B9DA|nr:Ig-like domain-containing protein [uncultured Methanobrevibacter sp.]
MFILCFSLTTINASNDNNTNTNLVNSEDNSLSVENSLKPTYQSESDNYDNTPVSENKSSALNKEVNAGEKDNVNTLSNNKKQTNEEDSSLEEKSNYNIIGKATIINGTNKTIKYGSGTYYNVKLTDKANNPLFNKSIVFTINGKTINKTTDKNGIAKLLINLSVNKYLISYQFLGCENYTSSSGKSTINVVKSESQLYVSNRKILYKSGNKFKILLKDKYGKALAKQKVYIKLKNRMYTKTTNAKGYAYLSISGFALGKYPTVINYKGGKNYHPAKKSLNVYIYKIKTKIVAKSESFRYGLGQNYTVKLKNESGSPISSKTIVLKINGKTLKSKTSKNGIAYFKITESVGKYTAQISSYNTNTYYASSKKTTITVLKGKTYIKSSDVNTTYPSKAPITLKFHNANGNALKNREISVKINKKTYKGTTNNTGELCFKINLIPGTYKTVLSYGGSKNFQSSSKTITVKVHKMNTLINGKSETILEYNDDYYKVSLKDKNDNPLSGKTITFDIYNSESTLTLTGKTDSKGIARVQVNTYPGNYTISYEFKGDTYCNPSEGRSNLTVNTDPRMKTNITGGPLYLLKGKTGYFNIKLVNAKNNVGIANKNITITFKSRTFTRTTDGDGIVKLLVNGSTTGIHNISYEFKDTVFNESGYRNSKGKSFVKIIELKSGITLKLSEVKALDLPTITVNAMPSCLHCHYEMEAGRLEYKNYTMTFVNWCPFCKKIGKLTWNPKHVYEGELTCGSGTSKDHYGGGCDADFCGVCGYDKTVKLRAQLIKVVEG